VTNLNELSLYPAFSPDGKHLALLAAGGIYVMNPDGSNQVKLTNIGSVGTLDWTS
jgi:Tol biopolymer transport system component